MPITTTVANKITNAINVAFKKIGSTNGTLPPIVAKPKNTEHFAWEYHVASQLQRVAEARKKEAFSECIKAGLFPDPEKEPSLPGSNHTVYAGDNVNITLTVKKGSARVDAKEFCDALLEAGVDPKIVAACRDVATQTTRAPHQFTSSLLTKGD